MGVRRRLRQLLDDKSEVVEKASKVEKRIIQVDPLGRIADLKEAGADVTIEIERIGSDPTTGYQNMNLEIEDVEIATFRDEIFNRLGGGTFRFVFREADGRLLVRKDNGKPETHKIKVGGQPKGKEKAERAERKKEDVPAVYQMIIEQQNKNMELVITALKSNGQNASALETMKAAKEIFGDAAPPDFVQQLTSTLQLVNQFQQQQQNRAPVQTTGSTSTGIEKFFEGLGAAVPAFAPAIAAKLNPQGTPESPAALPPNTDGTVPPTNNPAAFAGAEVAHSPSAPPSTTTPPVVGTMNPIEALNAPLGPVVGAPGDPRVAAYGAIIKLRYLIQQKDDPHSIAGEVIDSINLIMGAQRIGGRWQNFIDEENAGTLFDQYAPMIPEFAADLPYMAECRAALLEVIHEHLNPESESIDEAEAEEEAEDEVSNTTVESEEVSVGTEAADDRTEG